MNSPEEQKGMIGVKTALVLFAALVVFAFWALKGAALVLALLIVGALAAKTFVHHLRRRIGG